LSGGRAAGPAARSLTGTYQQFRQQIHEGAKFLVVGGIGLVIVLAGSDALRFDLGLGKFTSVTVATVIATVGTLIGNRYWSFKDRQGAGARHETIVFFVLNGVGLLIQYACIGLVNDVIGLSGRFWYSVANLIGVGIGTLFRFWSYRKWIWVPPEVHQARLNRGRHRKGRPSPAPLTPAVLTPAGLSTAQSTPRGTSASPPLATGTTQPELS
jgi:putative flippase GtrA